MSEPTPATEVTLSIGLVPPGLPESVPVDGVVTEDQYVDIGWKGEPTLKLTEELPAGTEVKVYLKNDNLIAKTHALVEQEERETQRRREQQKWERERARIHKKARRKKRNREFWGQYDIPFDCTTATNDRLGELQRGSSGTGRTKHTAIHFVPLEPISEGRLRRDAREYLCQNEGQYATLRYQPTQVDEVPPPGEDKEAITCQSCLDRMERWRLKK